MIGLQGIGVLELVHEDVVEEPLHLGPDLEVGREEVAQQEQQVDLVDGAVAGLHLAVEGDDGRECTDEPGREPALGRAMTGVPTAPATPLLLSLARLLEPGPGTPGVVAGPRSSTEFVLEPHLLPASQRMAAFTSR